MAYGPRPGQIMDASNSPKSPGEIDLESNKLAEETSILLSLVNQIAERLNPVLRPISPNDDKLNNPKVSSCSTIVGRFMRETSDNLSLANEGLKSLLSRLEV